MNTRHGVKMGLTAVGGMYEKEFRKQVSSKNKSGKLYRIQGRLHRASAAYETPASVTGEYLRAVGYLVRGWDELTFGNRSVKAGWLEDGTRKMYPRYGLKNSINATPATKVAGILERSIKKFI